MEKTAWNKVAVASLTAAAAFASWSVVSTLVAINRLYEAASVPGTDYLAFSVDISPDPLQRELTVAVVLLLGVIALWSERSARAALTLGGSLYFLLEAAWWVLMPWAAFDRPTPLPHLLAGASWALGVWLYRAGRWALVAGLAPLFVLADVVEWAVETAHGRAMAGVAGVYPVTQLNDVLAGARWDHLVVVLLAACASGTIAVSATRRPRGGEV